MHSRWLANFCVHTIRGLFNSVVLYPTMGAVLAEDPVDWLVTLVQEGDMPGLEFFRKTRFSQRLVEEYKTVITTLILALAC